MESLEQKIVKAVHVLPDDKKAEVLEFVENLKENSEATYGTESVKNKVKIEEEKHALRMSIVGIANSGKGDLSQRVDEILAEGANKAFELLP